MNNFEFYLVNKSDGLGSGMGGVLGLSRPSDEGKMGDDWRGIGPVFLTHLADAGMVATSNFAIYLDSEKG